MILQVLELIKNKNVYGELLRELAFKPIFENGHQEIGCYNHFEVRDDWSKIKIKDLSVEQQNIIGDELGLEASDNQDLTVYRLPEEDIIMAYFWDSDGTLLFLLPNETLCINKDCKKNYNWEIYEV